jgi:hypothetical protein
MRRALTVAVLLAACACAASARADGDPASDYLYGLKTFIPFDAKIAKARQAEFNNYINAVNRAGYTIRVALIWSNYDLGSVTSLWRKPRQYARFLDAELEFVYKHRLLVVMPNGFGFAWPKHSSTREYALLSTIPIGPAGTGLIDAAQTAVKKLAAASGVTVTAEAAAAAKPAGHSNTHDRAVIILAATAGLAVAVLLRLVLRRRT